MDRDLERGKKKKKFTKRDNALSGGKKVKQDKDEHLGLINT